MILFLVEHLDRQRFTPYVGCLQGGGELLRRAEALGVSVRHFGSTAGITARGAVDLVEFIRAEHIDLVQTYGLRADTVGRLAAKLGGAPVVVSSIRSIDPWRKWWHVWLDRLTSPAVDKFISNSEAGRQATIQREGYAAERIAVVHSGVPCREIPRENRQEILHELGVFSDAFPVVGILANLREMKGHADVIEALPAILERFPSAVFLFAGRDDSKGVIAEMARQRALDYAIRFLGYVEETPKLLAVMDIFLLPSHWEGLPAAIVEAMHAELPIIATRVGGIPELVRHEEEALLIEPRNPCQIAEAVCRLASDRELAQRLAAAAKARARNEFSIEAMVRKTEQIFAELLARKCPTPRCAR